MHTDLNAGLNNLIDRGGFAGAEDETDVGGEKPG